MESAGSINSRSGGKYHFIQTRRRRAVPVLLVAAVGALASLATSALVHHWESDAALEDLRSRFKIEARERVIEIRQELDSYHLMLRSLGSFFNASETVTRDEFRLFARELLNTVTSIRALGWVPRVEHAQRAQFEEQARIEIPGFRVTQRETDEDLSIVTLRDEYFPLYFFETHALDDSDLGLDFASEPVPREALYRARDSGRFAVSGPIFLGQEAEKQASLIGYLPVYRKGSPPTSEASRRQSLDGLVVVLFHAGESIRQAITRLPSQGIDVWVFDGTGPASPELLYAYADPAFGGSLPRSPPDSTLTAEDTLDVGGRRWEVVSQVASGALVPPPSEMSRFTLVAGLLITGTVAWYVRALQRYGLEMARANLALDREVAEHRQTGDALKKSEQRFRQILESAADAILISDGQGRIRTVNRQAERLFGYTREELIGQPVELLLPDQLRAQHVVHRRDYYVRPRKRPVLDNQELAGRHKDGSALHLEISLSPTGRGKEQMVTAIVRDISARKAAEAELRRLNRTHKVLSRSSSSLARSADAGDLLTAFCNNLVDVGGYGFAWVGYAQQDRTRSIRMMAHAGRIDAEFSVTRVSWSDSDADSSPCGTAIRTGKPVVVRDMEREPGFKAWREHAQRLGYRSMIALPLKSNSDILGNFSIFSTLANAFNDKEVALLTELAEDLTFGIETLRARSAHERKVRLLRDEVERDTHKRIAATLHDGVAQSAQAVNLGLKRLRALAAQEQGLRADLFDQLVDEIGGIIRDLRGLSHELRPPLLERMGLLDAIRYHCSELADRAGIEVRVAAQDLPLQLGDRTNEQCFLAFREALGNVVKHAHASRVDVVVEVLPPDRLALRIVDDGVGFDPEREFQSPAGLGLAMITERAESIGGSAAVQSAPGRGTEVTITVPLEPNLVVA